MQDYRPLVQFNPTEKNMREDSSLWLAQRGLMPGVGNSLISFPQQSVATDGYAARTCLRTDIAAEAAGQFAVVYFNKDTQQILRTTSFSLQWRGQWMQNVGNKFHTAIGVSTSQRLSAPFNSFNVGFQCRKNWRPKIAN